MKKIKILKVLSIVLFTMLGTTVALNAIVYETLPSRTQDRGFYYWLDILDYPNLLQSNMPLDILIGYIVADSVVRVAPHTNLFSDSLCKLNRLSDTVQYLYKYWYLLSEYDPLRFFSFVKQKKRPGQVCNVFGLHSNLRGCMYAMPQFTYVVSNYILHVYVNNTVHIDTVNPDRHYYSSTIAYCKVLDTIKGGKFPSLSNAIFYNGPRPNPEECGIVDNTYTEALFPPTTPDVVFSYMDQWEYGKDGWPLYNPVDEDEDNDENGEIKWRRYNPGSGYWVKPNREYIVFLEFFSLDAIGEGSPIGYPHKIYYILTPYPHVKSRSMYPIEDGYVIDHRNAMGWGTKVPVEEFKQNIRDAINEIKRFGE